ncbi:hypothetical protein Pmani_001180 [Petrolisthes manimaculis]|uniref:BED-type domain-containing protein n=1 Tax=Petrolisthes manimaculis TaxID=1843537 RepID=A0AAE1QNC7_9EUCA|nr:hypothetical protein Pmani_001180 [Petrolisthes manimaculis]
MRESGILDHFYQRAMVNITECLKPIKSEALRPLTLGDFYGIFSIYLGDGAAPQNFTEEKETSKTDASSSHKKRQKRWNDDYIAFEFFRPVHEASNPFLPAKCLFCDATYSYRNAVPSNLARHVKTKHPEHQNKSKQFFKATLASYLKQQSAFKSKVKPSDTKSLTLASLKMTHIVLRKKKPVFH